MSTEATPAARPPAGAARRQRLADRLARTLIVWVGSLWVIAALGVVWYVDREINRNFDSEMRESAHRMLDIAMHDYGQATAGDRPPPSLPLTGRAPLIDDDPVVFQLVAADGPLLMRSREAPLERFAVPLGGGFAEAGGWRVYTVAHPARPLLLHLADPLAERRLHLNRALLGLVVPLVAVLPLLAWLLRRVARRELRVLHRLEAQIGDRGSSDLSPLRLDGLPSELHSVGEHVNRLLERLAHALDVERALAANAAHELRTPLAAVRLRLQTALDGELTRPQIEAALRGLSELSHRTEKLLQLSRAESGAALARDPVDLVSLAATVIDEFWTAGATRPRIDLVLDDGELLPARGDIDAIAVALRNLIENAMRYAPGRPIEVALARPSSIGVRDHGCGVDPTLLGTLTRRHVRHADDSAGYGLGLSIVATVVEKQGGRFELRSPRSDGSPGLEGWMHLEPSVE